jgi:hypothetical protein
VFILFLCSPVETFVTMPRLILGKLLGKRVLALLLLFAGIAADKYTTRTAFSDRTELSEQFWRLRWPIEYASPLGSDLGRLLSRALLTRSTRIRCIHGTQISVAIGAQYHGAEHAGGERHDGLIALEFVSVLFCHA